jgi:hypothetical protein
MQNTTGLCWSVAMAALGLSARDDSKLEYDILVFSADKVDAAVSAGSTPSRARATRASEIACGLPATSRVPCHHQSYQQHNCPTWLKRWRAYKWVWIRPNTLCPSKRKLVEVAR